MCTERTPGGCPEGTDEHALGTCAAAHRCTSRAALPYAHATSVHCPAGALPCWCTADRRSPDRDLGRLVVDSHRHPNTRAACDPRCWRRLPGVYGRVVKRRAVVPPRVAVLSPSALLYACTVWQRLQREWHQLTRTIAHAPDKYCCALWLALSPVVLPKGYAEIVFKTVTMMGMIMRKSNLSCVTEVGPRYEFPF
ncbi:hypothetical protein AcV7_003918 [Taiwanofungus camphoratus]|nr:hypothetical protein AcV7_003918 [Antrodia cinnamomea]